MLREFAHLKRKKINQLIKEMVAPIEQRLLDEHGVTISATGEATKKRVEAAGVKG